MAVQILELGRGVYSFAEVAKLLKVPRARVREWCIGQRPVLSSGYAPIDGIHAISFLDVVEVHVAAQLRACGVAGHWVRGLHHRLQADLRTPTPFARRELLKDSNELLLRHHTKDGDKAIHEAINNKHLISKMILPFLKQLHYSTETCLASRWDIAEGVCVDPRYHFGQPTLVDSAIPTSVLAAEYHANGQQAEKIAGWFGVTAKQVLCAVRFEEQLAA